MVLGLASVNPDIHQTLHGGNACPHHGCGTSHDENSEDPPEPGVGCPVVCYGQGLLLALALELPGEPLFAREARPCLDVVVPFARAPLIQRSRAPPTVLFA